jgi:hypothetical protein
MEWINLHTSTLDSEEFLSSEPESQATWLKLLRYCAGQENGGVIRQAAEWTDRQWRYLVRVEKSKVQSPSRLWMFNGEDLVVKFYPSDKEKEVQTKRKAGKDTQAKLAGKQKAEQKAEHGTEPEGKGREGKGREVEGNGNAPTPEQALAWFAENESGYADWQVKAIWDSFNAAKVGGCWVWGKVPVSDWRSAMFSRIAERFGAPDKKNAAAPSARSVYADYSESELWSIRAGQNAAGQAEIDAELARRKGAA